MRRACWLLSTLPFLLQTTTHAQDAAQLVDRLRTASATSALDTADVKPWHLKMTVQLFDEKGKPSDQGTIEEWWNSPDLDRREYKTGGYTATEIRSGGKLYRTAGVDMPPYYLELLRQQVVHPIPSIGKTGAKLHKQQVGKIALDCIELQPANMEGTSPVGAFPTYCVVAGGDSLRITMDHSLQEIVRALVGQFQGKEVAVDAIASANNITAATEHVESLSGGAAPEVEFATAADTPEVVPPTVSAVDREGVVMGDLVSHAAPLFPVLANAQHATGGVVLLRAIVRADGGIRSTSVIASTNPVFEGAAMDAVRQWKYKPSTRDGQPVEVENIIVVHFATANR